MAENPSSDVGAGVDVKLIVEQGYNQIGPRYRDWINSKGYPRAVYVDKLIQSLSSSTNATSPSRDEITVVELGCGPGKPVTQMLFDAGYHVIANDISMAQIELAKEQLGILDDDNHSDEKSGGSIEFRHGDMFSLSIPPGSLDAVVAFYSIIHLPRDEQVVMFRKIWEWLKPGRGYMVINLATTEEPGSWMKNWLGADRVYTSSYDMETNLMQIKKAGFEVEREEVIGEDEHGKMVPFWWIMAKKV